MNTVYGLIVPEYLALTRWRRLAGVAVMALSTLAVAPAGAQTPAQPGVQRTERSSLFFAQGELRAAGLACDKARFDVARQKALNLLDRLIVEADNDADVGRFTRERDAVRRMVAPDCAGEDILTELGMAASFMSTYNFSSKFLVNETMPGELRTGFLDLGTDLHGGSVQIEGRFDLDRAIASLPMEVSYELGYGRASGTSHAGDIAVPGVGLGLPGLTSPGFFIANGGGLTADIGMARHSASIDQLHFESTVAASRSAVPIFNTGNLLHHLQPFLGLRASFLDTEENLSLDVPDFAVDANYRYGGHIYNFGPIAGVRGEFDLGRLSAGSATRIKIGFSAGGGVMYNHAEVDARFRISNGGGPLADQRLNEEDSDFSIYGRGSVSFGVESVFDDNLRSLRSLRSEDIYIGVFVDLGIEHGATTHIDAGQVTGAVVDERLKLDVDERTSFTGTLSVKLRF